LGKLTWAGKKISQFIFEVTVSLHKVIGFIGEVYTKNIWNYKTKWTGIQVKSGVMERARTDVSNGIWMSQPYIDKSNEAETKADPKRVAPVWF
jgi:hypothetical protein